MAKVSKKMNNHPRSTILLFFTVHRHLAFQTTTTKHTELQEVLTVLHIVINNAVWSPKLEYYILVCSLVIKFN